MARAHFLARHLVYAVVALLGWAVMPAASAGMAPAILSQPYTYDGLDHTDASAGSSIERAPPAWSDRHFTYDADDLQPQGIAARPNEAATASTTTYTVLAWFAQVAQVVVTTKARVQGHAWALSLPARGGVAAKTEAVAARAVPKLGVKPNFVNPAETPGEGWVWRGTGDAGSSKGSWYNPTTKESLHPDLAHPDPIGPHYDWKAPDGVTYRVYPDGTVAPK